MINCKECNKTFKSQKGLFVHISKKHNNREYYDKWINDVICNCEICGARTDFQNLRLGYKKYCDEHYHKWNHIQIEKAMIKKYGVKSFLSLQDLKEKAMIKKYGVDNPFKSEEIKEKIKKTNMEKYGVEYPSQSKNIRHKIRQSFKKRYGVDYALQHKTFHEQQLKSACYSKKYKNTNINYRGSYELDFLEKFHQNFLDIQNAPSVKYTFSGNRRVYHPDFYIPSLNLVVEIKNSYLLKKDEKIIKAKEKAAIDSGFKYILIVDKNYTVFISLVSYSV